MALKFVVTDNRFLHVKQEEAPCADSWLEEFDIAGSGGTEPAKLWVIGFKTAEEFEKFILRNGPCTIREHPDEGFFNHSENRWMLLLQMHKGIIRGDNHSH